VYQKRCKIGPGLLYIYILSINHAISTGTQNQRPWMPVLGIRVGIPHMTKFDVGGFDVGGGSTLGGALTCVVCPGEIDAPAYKRNLSGSEFPKIDATTLPRHN